jgi:hypothetical protein
MIRNDKLLLNSNELVKKILYNLFISTRQNSEYVKQYYLQEYIPDFYKNVRDFKRDDDSLFFISFESIKKWKGAMTRMIDSEVFSEINDRFVRSLENNTITLFSNENLTNDKDLWLCCETTSLMTACAFFNMLRISDRADVEIAKRKDYEDESILKTFRGTMVSVLDRDFIELEKRVYGNKKYFIFLFKVSEEKTKIACLFKYKRER